ncbi:hypothetical protein HDU67_000758 [Dinochytrium kinnereticum]|nr:hypothetical protein HDU67_000758 [Dinochytrium kinnereticum]
MLMNQVAVDPLEIPLPDSQQFVAGRVNSSRLAFWCRIVPASPLAEATCILSWVQDGICLIEFLRPAGFTGRFWGQFYSSRTPPPRIFRNHPLSPQSSQFVTSAVMDELCSGARCKVCPVRGAPRRDIPHIVAPTGIQKWP